MTFHHISRDFVSDNIEEVAWVIRASREYHPKKTLRGITLGVRAIYGYSFSYIDLLPVGG